MIINKNLPTQYNITRYLYDMKYFVLRLLLIIGLLSGGKQYIFAQSSTSISPYNHKEVEARIYPNPTDDYFKVETTSKVKRVTISDIFGKVIFDYRVTPDNRYNVATLNKGVYIVRIWDTENQPIKVVRLSKS